MSRRRALSRRSDPTGVVTWGWYSVLPLPRDVSRFAPGGEVAEMLQTALTKGEDTTLCAFYAVWWTEDPRVHPDASPDDMGVIVGPRAHAEAVGAADRACRRNKSERVYAMSIGDEFARRAYRVGVRREQSSVLSLRQAGQEALRYFGLVETISIDDAKRAVRRFLVTNNLHPDRGGTPEAFREFEEWKKLLYEFLKLRDKDATASAYARGETVVQKPKRTRKKKAKVVETEAVHGAST